MGIREGEPPGGFVLPAAMVLFAWLRRTQPTNMYRWYWDRTHPVGQDRTRAVVNFVDGWVLVGSLVTVVAYSLVLSFELASWVNWILTAFVCWRLVGIVSEAWNASVLDELRRSRPLYASPRSFVLGWLNLAESVVAFAMLYALHDASYFGLWRTLSQSLEVGLLIDLSAPPSTAVRTLVIAQLVTSLSVLVIFVRWAASLLPSRDS
jgi:hypothetical protein